MPDIIEPKLDLPEMEPEEKKPNWMLISGILVVIVLILAFLVWSSILSPRWQKPTTPATPATVVTSSTTAVESPIDTLNSATGTVGSTSTATSTESAEQPVVQDETGVIKNIGDTAELFLNDLVTFVDQSHPERRYTVQILEFTDSRCPAGVQCIWAGEQGVRVRVSEIQSGRSGELYLGTERAKTATLFGLNFVLGQVDEGKGGTYAEVTVK